MNILFCMRRDAGAKPGGDSGKVNKYASYLRGSGHNAIVVTDSHSLRNLEFLPDIVHIFNVQTPYENYVYLNWARNNNLPLVFSTIHHQEEFMRMYYAQTFLGRILGYQGYLYVSSLVKEFVRYKSLRNLVSFIKSPVAINSEIIQYSQFVLPLSDSETEHLEKDLPVKICRDKVRVIPNGLTFINEGEGCDGEKDIDVLVVGRIEPRKNQLKIAEALTGGDLKVVFLGDANLNHKNYFSNFKNVVDFSGNLTYLGPMSQAQLLGFYKRSKVNLSNSWFEVVSQVDLESASVGCKSIVSSASAIFDYFDGPVLSLSPICSGAEIVEKINSAIGSDYYPSLKAEYVNSWACVVEKLLDVYKSINK